MNHTAELQEVSSFYPAATSHSIVERSGRFTLWRTTRQRIEPEQIYRVYFYTITEDGKAVAVAIPERNAWAQWDFHIGADALYQCLSGDVVPPSEERQSMNCRPCR